MKIDLVKEDKKYYNAKAQAEIVEFPPLRYLGLEGQGAPAADNFNEAVEALYSVAYGVKNIYKSQDKDFAVPKLEALWWVDSVLPALEVPREEWYWNLLIRMPYYVQPADVDAAVQTVYDKKKLAKVREVIFQVLDEGKCAQIMHTGPYSTEPETIRRLQESIVNMGYQAQGMHHEIYLSDPRKTEPDKMKTILRQPIGKR
ncbi:MAG TPA: GyrI-like domain-containing protein [Bellilinea sp.]|nr:GyrI-like domain-containing protein [Bellilinea sp.]